MAYIPVIDIAFTTGGNFAEVIMPEGGNVSNPISQQNIGKGFAGFHLGKGSKLDGSCKFYPKSGYPGFCSQYKASIYTEENPLSISLINATSIYIFFDAITMEHATKMILRPSGTVILNDAPISKIEIGDDTHLDIVEWSNPDLPIKITAIVTDQFVKTFKGQSLISFDCSKQRSPSTFNLSYGILQQYADIKLYDRERLLQLLALNGLLVDNLPVTVSLLNTENSNQKVLGKYVSDIWDKSGIDNQVTLNCKDPSETFEKITFPSLNTATRSLHDFLVLCFDTLNFVQWQYADTEVEQLCKSVFTPNSWIYTTNVKEALTKACNLGMLRISCEEGIFVVSRSI